MQLQLYLRFRKHRYKMLCHFWCWESRTKLLWNINYLESFLFIPKTTAKLLIFNWQCLWFSLNTTMTSRRPSSFIIFQQKKKINRAFVKVKKFHKFSVGNILFGDNFLRFMMRWQAKYKDGNIFLLHKIGWNKIEDGCWNCLQRHWLHFKMRRFDRDTIVS